MTEQTGSISVLLGTNIKNRRLALGLSQDQFAEKIGLGQQSLSRIERGVVAPKMERLPAIAAELNCSIANLFISPEQLEEEIQESLSNSLAGLSTANKQFIAKLVSEVALHLKECESE